ncbi:MAG: hypothetical protein GF393_04475 [Armatimonadia bacterium]|nr:hypothetical protein [Armatimonadia bacterium]
MGAFYTNVTLNGPEQDEVAQYIASRNRQSLVSPAIDGITVVYDALTESQDPRLLTNLARELSAQFDCPALAALNHDGDILWLQLQIDGRLIDEYDSTPGYFEDVPPSGPEGGDADALRHAFESEDRSEEIERILRRRQGMGGFVSASQRHTRLAEALGIPSELVTIGYEYLAAGEVPPGYSAEDFVHTGPVPQAPMRTMGPMGGQAGPGAPPPPGGAHVHIGPAPGGGCCGCLLAPLLIPLGLAMSAWSAWMMRRHADHMRDGRQ